MRHALHMGGERGGGHTHDRIVFTMDTMATTSSSIPPALLSRLKRRGILRRGNPCKFYSDRWHFFCDIIDERPNRIPNCPNVTNPYHQCCKYCEERWVMIMILHANHFHRVSCICAPLGLKDIYIIVKPNFRLGFKFFLMCYFYDPPACSLIEALTANCVILGKYTSVSYI